MDSATPSGSDWQPQVPGAEDAADASPHPPAPIALPVALQVIAWLWIISGVTSVLGMLIAMATGHFLLDAGFLGIFVGRGMLHLRRGWWVFAVVMLCLMVGLAVLVGLALLAAMAAFETSDTFSFDGPTLDLFGQPIGHVPNWFVIVMASVAVVGFVAFSWLHLLPGVRQVVNAPQRLKRRRYLRRPRLAATIVVAILLGWAALFGYGYHLSRGYYIWKLAPPAETLDQTWHDRWQWQAEPDKAEPAASLTSVDLIVEARLDGELIAEANLRLTYAYADADDAADEPAPHQSMRISHLELEDLSPTPEGRHAIVTTSGFDSLNAAMTFHLVTEDRDQPHRTAGYAREVGPDRLDTWRGPTSGPALQLQWLWRPTREPDPMENLSQVTVMARELLHVSNEPTVFSESQPIHWTLRIKPSIAPPDQQRVFEVLPGER